MEPSTLRQTVCVVRRRTVKETYLAAMDAAGARRFTF